MRSGHLSLLLEGTGPNYAEISLLEELFLLWPGVTSHFPLKRELLLLNCFLISALRSLSCEKAVSSWDLVFPFPQSPAPTASPDGAASRNQLFLCGWRGVSICFSVKIPPHSWGSACVNGVSPCVLAQGHAAEGYFQKDFKLGKERQRAAGLWPLSQLCCAYLSFVLWLLLCWQLNWNQNITVLLWCSGC